MSSTVFLIAIGVALLIFVLLWGCCICSHQADIKEDDLFWRYLEEKINQEQEEANEE